VLKNFTRSSGFKVFLLGFLTLVLLIPIAMIDDVIHERSRLAKDAEREITSVWGGEFIALGPILQMPLKRLESVVSKNKGGAAEKKEVVGEYVYRVAPALLNVEANLKTLVKYRGIFSVPLYEGEVVIAGRFDAAKIGADLSQFETINPKAAEIVFALAGQKSIRAIKKAEFNGQKLEFNAGDRGFIAPEIMDEAAYLDYRGAQYFNHADTKGGIYAKAPLNMNGENRFEIVLQIQGGKSFKAVPIGGESEFKIAADWGDPSFNGAYLPIERAITEKGFEAKYQINYLSRNIPATWSTLGEASNMTEVKMKSAMFGVDFYKALDHYALNIRAVKYAILFLIVPFLALFVMEIVQNNKRVEADRQLIHPAQYLIAGVGNLVFYLLLLAFSEHINFHLAYFISAIASTLLLALYAKSLFKSGNWKQSGFIAIIMALCYAFLFVTLLSQDWALLIGAIFCFITIAATMYFTRKVEWYRD
jgi:inner membrane protein